MSVQSLISGGGLWGGAGNTSRTALLPGTPNKYDPAYGGVPQVPSLAGTSGTSIRTNLSNLPDIASLTHGLDTASGAGVMAALAQEIPGIAGSIGSATGDINELLSGQVPEDVINQLRQQSAEIGAGSGMGPMSPFSNANYLKALGLTSIGMKNQGLGALNSLMGAVPRAPSFDPSSMMVTPGQEQESEYMAQVLANAPVPSAAAKANLDALKAGTNYLPTRAGSTIGGFNVPIRGGGGGGDPYAYSNAYLGAGGGGGGDGVVVAGANPGYQYNPSEADIYKNWNAEQAKWMTGNPAASAMMGQEYDPEIDAMNQNVISDIPGLDMMFPESDYYGDYYGD